MPTSFIESSLKNAINLQRNDLQKMTNINEKAIILHGSLSKSSVNDKPIFMIYTNPPKCESGQNKEKSKAKDSLWNCPMTGKLRTMWWIYTWPIKFVLTLTIPNPKTYRRMYLLTFVLCIIWIGLNSYVIVWMMTVIGEHNSKSKQS